MLHRRRSEPSRSRSMTSVIPRRYSSAAMSMRVTQNSLSATCRSRARSAQAVAEAGDGRGDIESRILTGRRTGQRIDKHTASAVGSSLITAT